ncbi:hypothetical protein [Zhongshania marina]|uniref:hypothetical protein n=1 Tax=Zhongshania marina TaxID=2304603 RepID=UPI0011CE731B
MNELLTLRWKERDRELQKEFLRVRQEMASRGILNSSETIKKAYEAIEFEFGLNRQMITQTIVDHVVQLGKVAKAGDYQELAQGQLSERKQHLERNLENTFKNILSGLSSKAMIEPFRSLNNQYELATRELDTELNKAIIEYNKAFGSNLTDQLKNQFLNNPVLAVIILSAAGATFIAGLLRLMGVIGF